MMGIMSAHSQTTDNKELLTSLLTLNDDSLFSKGIGYISSGENTKALLCFQLAAKNGHANSQAYTGLCYAEGIGVEQNQRTALEWFAKAAEQDNALAETYIGACYTDGIVVEKDAQKAFFWFEKAAKQGYVMAQYLVGLCYENGEGVEKNIEEAKLWYGSAAGEGNEKAQERLDALLAEEGSNDVLDIVEDEDDVDANSH